jgi:carboxylesterase type B
LLLLVASGLFHRAILMSGTALADWALTAGSVVAIQVSHSLNCPFSESNNEMAACLRKRRLEEIMDVKVDVPEFKTRFGPMVDGNVVPNDPFHLTGVYKDLFSR